MERKREKDDRRDGKKGEMEEIGFLTMLEGFLWNWLQNLL